MFETIEVVLPREAEGDVQRDLAAAKRFLFTLSLISASPLDRLFSGKPRFTFEVISHAGAVQFFLGTQRAYVPFLEQQVYAHYPDAKVRRVSKNTSFLPYGATRTGFLRPSHAMRPFDCADALLRSFRRMRKTDRASVSYGVRPTSEAKFLVTARIFVSARSGEDADRLFENITASFDRYSVVQDTSRASHAFTLHADQLAMLYRIFRMHPAPSAGMIPQGISNQGTLLGHAEYAGATVPLYISDTDRKRHVYCAGHAGTGRRVLLLTMIMQDILAGKHVAVVDLDGELVDEVRHRIFRSDGIDARNVVLCSSRDEAASLFLRMDSLKGFSLYIDEFQDFLPNIGENLISQASILGICLVLTHQSIAGMPERMITRILESIGTRVSYDDSSKFNAAVRLSAGGVLQEVRTMATDETGVL